MGWGLGGGVWAVETSVPGFPPAALLMALQGAEFALDPENSRPMGRVSFLALTAAGVCLAHGEGQSIRNK